MFEKNTVKATEQVKKDRYVEDFQKDGKVKVLFIGNSITRHEPKPEIGWDNDWGMAASCRENDYVHVAVRFLEEKFGKINYCVANCGHWELNYYNDEMITDWQRARDFNADIVVVRIGENIWNVKDKFIESPLAPHFDKMVKYFAVNPNAKVIVTGLFWRCVEIESAIKHVVEENNYSYVYLEDLGDDCKNMAIGQYWHEGVSAHPADEGMRKIAERIVEKI